MSLALSCILEGVIGAAIQQSGLKQLLATS